MNIDYRLSNAAKRELFIQTGASSSDKYRVNPAELSVEARRALVERLGLLNTYDLALPRYSYYYHSKVVETPQEAEELISAWAREYDQRNADNRAALESELDAYVQRRREELLQEKALNYVNPPPVGTEGLPRYEEAQRLYQRLQEHVQRLHTERQDAQRRQQEAAEADRRGWITAHGSERLQRATAAGYGCSRLYATERAALEHPEYKLEPNEYDWDTHPCPSLEALAEAERVGGRVIRSGRGSGEAVVIEDFHGYQLTRVL